MEFKYIYLLKDPDTGAIRYVGCTTDPKRRFSHYIGLSTKNKVSPVNMWIRELQSKNKIPIMEVIEKIELISWKKLERQWISSCLNNNCDLLNLTLGGEGHFGYNVSQQTANKISNSNKGRKLTSEQLKTWSKVKIGNTATKGLKYSQEILQKRVEKRQQIRFIKSCGMSK